PADLRLFEFFAAELFRLLLADLADALDGLAAIVEAAPLEFALSGRGGLDGGVDVLKDAPGPGVSVLLVRRGAVGADLRQHLHDNAANQIVGELHGDASYCVSSRALNIVSPSTLTESTMPMMAQ